MKKETGSSLDRKQFRRLLLAWFDANKRNLPWRKDRDPYRVWLSEVMLQQTRVAAAIDHYNRFLKRFPTIERLAVAREASVLTAWSGLGYYRRARMLHAAAKKIVRELEGKFPLCAAELMSLPGVGRYTASAIASICFEEPIAVVDGNVERVVQRVTGTSITGEHLWTTADEFLDHKRPGDFNQAMMELGATVCLPRQPQCLLCPVNALCTTRGEHPRAEKTPQRKREVCYALNQRDGSVLLVRRDSKASLMAGMWELPEVANPNGDKPLFTVKHSITVTDYTVKVVKATVAIEGSSQWIAKSRLGKLPLTGLTRKILRAAAIL